MCKVDNIADILNTPGVWLELNDEDIITDTWFVTENHHAIRSTINPAIPKFYTKSDLEKLQSDLTEGSYYWMLDYELFIKEV